MKFQIKRGSWADIAADALVLPHFKGEALQGAALQIDFACGGLLKRVLSRGDFEGKSKQALLLYTENRIPVPRIVLAGLGERARSDLDGFRTAYAGAVSRLKDCRVKALGVSLDFGRIKFSAPLPETAALEGILLGDYSYRDFKTSAPETAKIEDVYISDGDPAGLAKADLEAVRSVGHAVCAARDLGNAPSNALTPAILARFAQRMARSRNIQCTVLDRGAIEKAGMKALLGVAQGSKEPPRFIVLEYRGGKRRDGNIVLVGKGITFDSGGISLKPSEKMGEMKADMAGAAAVIGGIQAAADLALPLNIVGLVPATENMPDGQACKPGDILASLKGKTIEIISTDAEGRLILADAFAYAERFKPALMVDIATLTGACVVALGEEVAGFFTNDKALGEKLARASEVTGEKIWELPLWDCYQELIKSDVADLKNTGGRNGGAITAAAFLSQFAGSRPWAHVDIAGPGFSTKDRPYIPKGATGFGVRLLVQFLIECCRPSGGGRK